ncbi:MAG: hypothetical protein NTU73_15580 [Ignavibacteriae bacterium]|nr:hypothetical protein [Ignavibacteriota bacterium]
MAKAKTNIKSKKSTPASHIHIALSKKNYMIIGLGILLIVIGYILMAANSVDGFLPTVIAPILLVAGYCVVIPIGILLKDKTVSEEVTDYTKVIQADKGGNVSVSSNIKTK